MNRFRFAALCSCACAATIVSLVNCDLISQKIDPESAKVILDNIETLIDTETPTTTDKDTATIPKDEVEPPPPPPKPKPGILFASYPFEGNAEDISGNKHHAKVNGATLTSDRFGQTNSAYSFDGQDDYIIATDFSDFPEGNTPRTIAGWFKSSKKDPYLMMLFGFGATNDGYNFQVGIGPGNYSTTTTFLAKTQVDAPPATTVPASEFRVNGWGDSYDWRTGIAPSEYLDGTWHHCAVTYDGITTSIYFDGVFKTSTTQYRYIADPAAMNLVIGHEIDLDEWAFEGALDDIKVFTRALDSREVFRLYSPEETSRIYASYPFNGNAKDESGNSHDAVVSGATLTKDRFGNDASAYLFDGEKDFIKCADVADFPAGKSPRTIAGWFTSTNSDPYIMMLFGIGSTTSTGNFQVGIGPGPDGANYRVNGWGDSYDWRSVAKAPEYLDGKWHHVAVTYDGMITKIYFDGILRDTTDEFDYVSYPSTASLVIGREIDLDGWEWKGAIDDVLFYTDALTADEIKSLVDAKQ